MIKIQRHFASDIICSGLSSDPMKEGYFLCQMEDGDIKEIYYKEIKHIKYEN